MPVIAELNIQAISRLINRASKELEADMAARAAEAARELAPVRTGQLRESIASNDSGEVTSTSPAAEAIEYGTSRTPARPFVTPAVEQVSTEVPGVARQIARKHGLGKP